MIRISKHRLAELFETFAKRKLVVIGDLMLDRYISGKVSRLSPEAPVPVVEVEEEFFRFGGAANVVLNVSTLGASVFPIGLIGEDDAGRDLKGLFQEHHFDLDGLLVDSSRQTTVKTRVIADCQHVVRTDWEQTHPVSDALQDQIMSLLKNGKEEIDGIILQDYNKGLLTPSLIEKVIAFANQNNIMTFVDPKYENFLNYKNVTLFKPNRKEAAERLNMKLSNDEDLIEASKRMFSELNCQAVLITLGEGGMMLFKPDDAPSHVHTKAVKVHDVSGAGDTVISTMAVAMVSDASFEEAATLANHAAGIVCGEVGVVPIKQEELYQELLKECESK